jgi:hypothetical protein
MASSDITGIWQLYTFSAVNILFALSAYGIFFDSCQLIKGESCKPGAEIYMTRMVSIGLLYIGVFFLVLTHINKTNAPKLGRLASMAMKCCVALLVSVIFFGPRSRGGVENSTLQCLDLIGCFVLIAIMASALINNTNMANSNSPFTGLGMNPKTFNLLITILMFINFIGLSEFVDISTMLADPASTTAFSHVMYQFLMVVLVMILLPLIFTLVYGDEKDNEIIMGALVVMVLVQTVSIIPIADTMKEGSMTSEYISVGVFCLFALSVIYFDRFYTRRQVYEPVSDMPTSA